MNKDKVIKDLKERNDSLNNQYRLRDIRCVHLENEVQEQEKEIERLNNIINELENILIKQIEEDKDTQNNKILFMRQEDKHILNTIKELKGEQK